MPGISVVITCFHNNLKNASNTQRCIEKIRENTPPHKLIIIENIERWFANEGDVYVGYRDRRPWAENANTGLRIADTEYICFINNDVFVPPGWLEAIDEVFRTKPDCGVATIDSKQFGRKPANEIIELFFGGIWVIKKEVADKVGLIDERFAYAFDDADYWVRVYKAGYKIYMNRKVMVEHKAGTTIFELNGERHKDIYVRNRMLFNKKHEGCGLPIFERLR